MLVFDCGICRIWSIAMGSHSFLWFLSLPIRLGMKWGAFLSPHKPRQPNCGTKVGRRPWRWPTTWPSAGVESLETRDIEPMLCQCWLDVYDVGPTFIQYFFNSVLFAWKVLLRQIPCSKVPLIRGVRGVGEAALFKFGSFPGSNVRVETQQATSVDTMLF